MAALQIKRLRSSGVHPSSISTRIRDPAASAADIALGASNSTPEEPMSFTTATRGLVLRRTKTRMERPSSYRVARLRSSRPISTRRQSPAIYFSKSCARVCTSRSQLCFCEPAMSSDRCFALGSQKDRPNSRPAKQNRECDRPIQFLPYPNRITGTLWTWTDWRGEVHALASPRSAMQSEDDEGVIAVGLKRRLRNDGADTLPPLESHRW